MKPPALIDFRFFVPQFPCSSGKAACAYPPSTFFFLPEPLDHFLYTAFHLFTGCIGLHFLLLRKKIAPEIRLIAFAAFSFFVLRNATPATLPFLAFSPLVFYFCLKRKPCCLALVVALITLGSGFSAYWTLLFFFMVLTALSSRAHLFPTAGAFFFALLLAQIRLLPEAFYRTNSIYFPALSEQKEAIPRLFQYFFPDAVALPFLWGSALVWVKKEASLFSPLALSCSLLFLLTQKALFPTYPFLWAVSRLPFQLQFDYIYLLLELVVLIYGSFGLELARSEHVTSREQKLLFFLIFFLPFASLTRKFAVTRDFYFFDDVFAQAIFLLNIGFHRFVWLLALFCFLVFVRKRHILIWSMLLCLAEVAAFPPKKERPKEKLRLVFSRNYYSIQGEGVFLPRSFSEMLASQSPYLYSSMGIRKVFAKEKMPFAFSGRTEGGFLSYRLPRPLSLPAVFSRVEKKEKREILAALSSGLFPLKTKTLSTEWEGKKGKGRIIWYRKSTEGMEAKVSCPEGCYLVTNLPSVKGFIIKQDFPTFTAHHGFLAVSLPSGESKITITYIPPFLVSSSLLSALTLLFLLRLELKNKRRGFLSPSEDRV